jgi:hypothetical protein
MIQDVPGQTLRDRDGPGGLHNKTATRPVSDWNLTCIESGRLRRPGVDLWQAAGFLVMSVETIERNYGHHHPTYMQEAARAIGYEHGKCVSLAESLAARNSSRPKSIKIV